jgi:uncharacterized protein (TIRG00374 family)
MEKIRSLGGLIVRLVISLGILVYLAFKVNWLTLLDTMRSADPRWCFFAWICFLPMLGITAWRWKILLAAQSIVISYWQAFRLCIISHFFNAFLLGTTGGDVVKIYYATQSAPNKKTVAGISVVVDRLIGLAVLVVIASFFCWWQYPLFAQKNETLAAAWTVFCIAAGGIIFGVASFLLMPIYERICKRVFWSQVPARTLIQTLAEAYHFYIKAWRANSAAVLLSVVNHSFQLLIGYSVAQALHVHIPFWPFISAVAVINLLVAIPVSISGLGVREGLCVAFLSLFAISPELAVSFSLMQFGIFLLWSLVGGLFYLPYKHSVKIA